MIRRPPKSSGARTHVFLKSSLPKSRQMSLRTPQGMTLRQRILAAAHGEPNGGPAQVVAKVANDLSPGTKPLAATPR